MNATYPSVDHFSKSIGIPAENLIKAFEIEKVFHQKILSEQDPSKRQDMYQQVYDEVHPIYGSVPSTDIFYSDVNPKEHVIWLFAKELSNKAVLDVGCGVGAFLVGIAKSLPHKKLLGLDVAVPMGERNDIKVEFQKADIVNFTTDETFDVIFSDNVIEHIAPADLDTHLQSLFNSLSPGGILIVLTPNRLFGPWDVTRIIDDSYSDAVPAQGTHLNEMTYGELIIVLKRNGFQDFKTVLPLAKIRRCFGGSRIPASILATMERIPFMVRLFRAIPEKWKILPAFEISIVCRKPPASIQ